MKLATLVRFGSSSNPRLNGMLRELGYGVATVRPGQLPEKVEGGDDHHIFVVVLDRRENDWDRYTAVLKRLKAHPTILLISASMASCPNELLSLCDEFVCWPCHLNELKIRLAHMRNPGGALETPRNDLRLFNPYMRMNMLGRSEAFLNMTRLVSKIAQCDATVMVVGETGTGKELVARAIHYTGARKNNPFIPVNCGAVPDTLIENEFFGHSKGAYTGAGDKQNGLICQAGDGTLFLDEVNALTLKAQVALLRFLQDGAYKPLGSDRQRQIDVRIIAACHTDPKILVEEGVFREDLMFRLNIMTLKLPPLRERTGDIELLSEYFLASYKKKYNQPQKRFHADTLDWMKRYHWPGNVRELENFVHRQFFLSDGGEIHYHPVEKNRSVESYESGCQYPITLDQSFTELKREVVSDFERRYLHFLMIKANGNVSRAARLAGKERRSLGKLLKKHGIRREAFSTQVACQMGGR